MNTKTVLSKQSLIAITPISGIKGCSMRWMTFLCGAGSKLIRIKNLAPITYLIKVTKKLFTGPDTVKKFPLFQLYNKYNYLKFTYTRFINKTDLKGNRNGKVWYSITAMILQAGVKGPHIVSLDPNPSSFHSSYRFMIQYLQKLLTVFRPPQNTTYHIIYNS